MPINRSLVGWLIILGIRSKKRQKTNDSNDSEENNASEYGSQ